jgi:hypothetical protein
MLLSAMFGDENWGLGHWCEPDDVLETLLIELLVLAATGPMNISHALEQLANGIASELSQESIDRSVEYANYRIGCDAF